MHLTYTKSKRSHWNMSGQYCTLERATEQPMACHVDSQTAKATPEPQHLNIGNMASDQ